MVSLLKNYLAASSQYGSAGRKNQRPEPKRALSRRHSPSGSARGRSSRLCKTPAAARNLSGQLTGAGFGKYYLAMVRGIPSPSEGDLEDHLVKDGRTNTSRVCTADTPGAKYARLHYHTVRVHKDQCPPVSLIESILTPGGTTRSGYRYPSWISSDRRPEIRRFRQRGRAPEVMCVPTEFLHPTDGRPMNFELSPPRGKKFPDRRRSGARFRADTTAACPAYRT